MSITLTGTGGLFTRLGKIGKVAFNFNPWQSSTVPGLISGILAQYESTLPAVVDGVADLQSSWNGQLESPMALLQQVAKQTVQQMCQADTPNQGGSLASSLQELIVQMIAASASVQVCTVAASQSALSPFTGNGVLVLTTKRGDGLVQENLVAETLTISCTADAQTGGATPNQERFGCTAAPDAGDPWSYLWPTGSGARQSLQAIDASQYQSAANVLYNGDFENYASANLPTNWVALAGVAGTDFKQSTAQFFDGASSLQLIGASATPASLTQQFNSSSGTTVQLQPQRSYAVNFWIKADVVPAAGVITVDLIDNTGAVIQDSQGNSNSLTVPVHSLAGTGWYSLAALYGASIATGSPIFRLPRVLPPTVRLRMRVSTAISSGTNIFIDRLAMGTISALYTGGPGAAIFSGNVPFIQGDGWNVTTTNNRGGSSNMGTFQALFDRLFNMRSLGLLLPSSASPTIADTLITS